MLLPDTTSLSIHYLRELCDNRKIPWDFTTPANKLLDRIFAYDDARFPEWLLRDLELDSTIS